MNSKLHFEIQHQSDQVVCE